MICENCHKEYEVKYASGRFCCKECSRGFSTKAKRKEINERVSQTLLNKPENILKRKNKNDLKNIFEVSSRTRSKIINRILNDKNIGCFECGWNEASCDIHHIQRRADCGTNDHNNLTVLCPNCHRKAHVGLIKEFKQTLYDIAKDNWLKYYKISNC